VVSFDIILILPGKGLPFQFLFLKKSNFGLIFLVGLIISLFVVNGCSVLSNPIEGNLDYGMIKGVVLDKTNNTGISGAIIKTDPQQLR